MLVADDDLAELTFAETDPGEALRSFCEATDFDAASVYLLAMPVMACREIRFRSVSVEPDDAAEGDLHPYAQFCEAYRPADAACAPDEFHTVGFAIPPPVAAGRSTRGGGRLSGSRRRRGRPPGFTSPGRQAGGDGT